MNLLCILLAPRATPQSHNASISLTDAGMSTVCPLFTGRQNRQTAEFPTCYLDSVSFTWAWGVLASLALPFVHVQAKLEVSQMVFGAFRSEWRFLEKKNLIFTVCNATCSAWLDIFSPITQISFHITSSCWCTISPCNSTQLSAHMYRQVNGLSLGHMETNNHCTHTLLRPTDSEDSPVSQMCLDYTMNLANLQRSLADTDTTCKLHTQLIKLLIGKRVLSPKASINISWFDVQFMHMWTRFNPTLHIGENKILFSI